MPGLKVIIIGSGLAGSLLANGLQRNDIQVTVYERLAKNAQREGYQIRLGPSALAGMRANLDPNRLKFIANKFGRAGGHKGNAPIVRDKHFAPLLDLSSFHTYEKSAAINRKVLRDALADPVDEAGNLRYGKQFSHYEIVQEAQQDRVKVHFADGTSDLCDVLIGADGSHSKINAQLGLNNLKMVGDYTSFIAKSDLPYSSFASMPTELREKPALTYADGKSLWFAAYLPDKQTQEAAVDIKPTNQKAAFDDTMSSCMFGLHIPTDRLPENILTASNQEKLQACRDHMSDWAPEYLEALELIKDVDIYAYHARVSSRPAQDWRNKARQIGKVEQGHSRVWLLGDSMHAMLPTRGMGGNQALRDTATVLPQLVALDQEAKAGRQPSTSRVAQACKAYEDEMIPRAFGWVQSSGGDQLMLFDSEKWSGTLFLSMATVVLSLTSVWSAMSRLIWTPVVIDDAPELRE